MPLGGLCNHSPPCNTGRHKREANLDQVLLLPCTCPQGEEVVKMCLHSNRKMRTVFANRALLLQPSRWAAKCHHTAFEMVCSWLIAGQVPQLLIQMVQCKSVWFFRHKQLIFQQATADKIAVSDCVAKRAVALVQKILYLESFQTFPFR